MISRALIAILVLLATSCAPEKKLQRLLAKHPELNRTDTIVIHDTIMLPADTVWREKVLHVHDTVQVENERVVARFIRVPTGSPCDTAAIAGQLTTIAKADTIYRETQVITERVVPCPPSKKVAPWWRWWAVIASALALAMFLLYRYPPDRRNV